MGLKPGGDSDHTGDPGLNLGAIGHPQVLTMSTESSAVGAVAGPGGLEPAANGGAEEGEAATKGVLAAEAVVRVDESQNQSGFLTLMSNSKMKKLQDKELRENKVEKLMKKVTVDRDRRPDDWASEYEARKAAALDRMGSGGAAAANVGSMSAFHTGLYGGEGADPKNVPPSASVKTSVQQPSPPKKISPLMSLGTTSSAPPQRTINPPPPQAARKPPVPLASTGDPAVEARLVGSVSARRPPPSPLDLLGRERRGDRQAFTEAAVQGAREGASQQSKQAGEKKLCQFFL